MTDKTGKRLQWFQQLLRRPMLGGATLTLLSTLITYAALTYGSLNDVGALPGSLVTDGGSAEEAPLTPYLPELEERAAASEPREEAKVAATSTSPADPDAGPEPRPATPPVRNTPSTSTTLPQRTTRETGPDRSQPARRGPERPAPVPVSLAALLQRASSQFENGDFVAADSIVSEILSRDPHYPGAEFLATAIGESRATFSGREVRRFEGHSRGVRSVALSPDGTLMASGSEDQTVRVWDTRTGRLIRTFEEHTDSVLSLAFSPDGRLVASAANRVKIWEVGTGRVTRDLRRHRQTVNGVAFDHTGRFLATVSKDDTLILWDLPARSAHSWKAHEGEARAVDFSPDGKLLASGGDDGAVRIWDAADGALVRELTGHRGVVTGVAFSPDGERLASSSRDDQTRVWEVSTGRRVMAFPGRHNDTTSVAFSPGGRWIAAGGDDDSVRVYPTDGGFQPFGNLPSPLGGIKSVAFGPSGLWLVGAAADNTVVQWEVGRIR